MNNYICPTCEGDKEKDDKLCGYCQINKHHICTACFGKFNELNKGLCFICETIIINRLQKARD
tara:strand:+ start:705 stop:893 length:189 start_codon:yes stop_codon:yes gene_type:complete